MKRLILLFICLILSSSFVLAQAAPDRDGDTVPDDSDRCVSEAGTVANHGCPERPRTTAPQEPTAPNTITNPTNPTNPDDNDGDGTSNSVDACPESGGPDWNMGCPVVPTEQAFTALPTVGNCVMASTTTVNRRALPQSDSEILGVMQAGEQFPVLAVYFNGNEGTSWYQTEPFSFVSTAAVATGGNCNGLPQIHFSNPVEPLPFGMAFVFDGVNILFGSDAAGNLRIAARPHDPVQPIDWLTAPDEEPEPDAPQDRVVVAAFPDPVDPTRWLIFPDYDEPTPDPRPLVITLGPITDPHPGLILDITAPDFDTCTFTDVFGDTNAASSRSYLVVQELVAWDANYVTYVQQPLFFWQNILMTEYAAVYASVNSVGASGRMRAVLGENDYNNQPMPNDVPEVILPYAVQLFPENFAAPSHYNLQVRIRNYSVPFTLNMGCIEQN